MRYLNNSSAASRERGMTLIELMIAITIAGILLVAGLPFFGEYVSNARLREGGSSLLTDALFAQSEAIKRNGSVALVVNNATVQVVDHSTGTEEVLRSRSLPDGVSAGSATVTFGSAGRPTPFGPDRPPINLSMSGVTCSDERRCPAIVIEGGGAIRLCGNQLTCP